MCWSIYRNSLLQSRMNISCKREMDIPPKKRAHVCQACKSENGRSNVFKEL